MSSTKITSEAASNRPALQGKDAIKKAQDGIRVSLVALDAAIHDNAVQCLMHCEKHGDTSLMTRLLVDIVDAKSGYRRQGLIQWMRKYSPMELTGSTINLTGVDGEGNKRPFKIDEAIKSPFTASAEFKEIVKPIFQDTLLAPFDRMIKAFEAAMENTVNGKPVDPSKPYYDGTHGDKVSDFFAEMKKRKGDLPADATREVRLTQARIAKDVAFVEANGNQSAKGGASVVEGHPEREVAAA